MVTRDVVTKYEIAWDTISEVIINYNDQKNQVIYNGVTTEIIFDNHRVKMKFLTRISDHT
jgi:hypothetical protein